MGKGARVAQLIEQLPGYCLKALDVLLRRLRSPSLKPDVMAAKRDSSGRLT